MSHVKAGGTAKNIHDSPGQRLGVKLYGGEAVKTGQVIVRQVGMNKRAGDGTFLSRNFTIHAAHDGIVEYAKRTVRTFSGRSVPRTEVRVVAVAAKQTTEAPKAPKATAKTAK
jgi:large subunit ribosomal protein L27